jgi:hypothetical protein
MHDLYDLTVPVIFDDGGHNHLLGEEVVYMMS